MKWISELMFWCNYYQHLTKSCVMREFGQGSNGCEPIGMFISNLVHNLDCRDYKYCELNVLLHEETPKNFLSWNQMRYFLVLNVAGHHYYVKVTEL